MFSWLLAWTIFWTDIVAVSDFRGRNVHVTWLHQCSDLWKLSQTGNKVYWEALKICREWSMYSGASIHPHNSIFSPTPMTLSCVVVTSLHCDWHSQCWYSSPDRLYYYCWITPSESNKLTLEHNGENFVDDIAPNVFWWTYMAQNRLTFPWNTRV